ncbi:PREDICTED: uncharacterized protein LOC108372422 [Rhagoletis zephyria]|uniref:uncharacterized protein LOC108372422 n=1 Tax=Rhagoletis zephyria TaxID=28612 RepID=UPI00081130D8|nr:PREDICTED: uncharacterized protein LOC108372422 [Rhagoletis zephyria]
MAKYQMMMVKFSASSTFLLSAVVLAAFVVRPAAATDATARQFWTRPGGIFSGLRLAGTTCTTDDGESGTCSTEADCRDRQGFPGGACGRSGSGLVCCNNIRLSCGATTSKNESFFVNPNYPSYLNSTATCQITVASNPGICQIRLDFEDFELAQPDEFGRCTQDSFMVRTTVGERLPMLCGENKGQHMYVDMGRGSANPVVLSVITNERDGINRKWKIKISFVKCDNYVMAPSGCLQYYRSPSDTIRTFNYGAKIDGKSRYLSNLRYSACIRVEENFCSIKWTTESADSFSWGVANDPMYNAQGNNTKMGLTGAQCNDDDYVGIDQGSQEGSGVGEDRFCGQKLFYNNLVISRSKPFMLKVRSNSDQSDNNRFSQAGAALTFTQLPCSV